MNLAVLYISTLIPFLIIDIVALRTVMLPLFERHVGALLADDTKLGVALGFYMFYVAGIIYFAILPGVRAEQPSLVILNGALLGFIAYGTYEATNMATLKGWSWSMVATDVVWGAILTASSAYLGYLIARGFGAI